MNRHCVNTNHDTSFSTLADAQAFCLQLGPSACSGVYDSHCDGGGSFYACKLGAFYFSSKGSCIYIVEEKDEFMFIRAKSCALCSAVTIRRIPSTKGPVAATTPTTIATTS